MRIEVASKMGTLTRLFERLLLLAVLSCGVTQAQGIYVMYLLHITSNYFICTSKPILSFVWGR